MSAPAKYTLPESNYSKLPHDFIEALPDLSEAELRVVLYTLRHTWGYGEYERKKRITLDEYENGRKRANGTRMDRGCGLKQNAIRTGLARAVENGHLVMEEDDSDLARVKRYYGIAIQDVTQGDPKDHPDPSKGGVSDPKDHSGRSQGSPDQGKSLLGRNKEKEKKSDEANPFNFKIKLIEVGDEMLDLRRKAELLRLSKARQAELQTIPEDTPQETPVVSSSTVRVDPLAYMNAFAQVEAHAYWQTFITTYPKAERLSARNAADLWQDIQAMAEIKTTTDEIEVVLKWRITPRRQKPYKFEYLLEDVKEIRSRAVPPVIDETLEIAVGKVFRLQAGDFTRRVSLFLSGKDGDMPSWNKFNLRNSPMSARELAGFKGWYDSDERYENQETPPKTPENLRSKIDEFRGMASYAGWVERAGHRLSQWLGTPPASFPTVQEEASTTENMSEQIGADLAMLSGMFGGGRKS